ncbi:MAG: archaellin/type IV pilin N-terminal domain-containing protein [Candidatus Aenigmatarchaeota archaeon]
MKGISAVIASILLLLITVALAGAAYLFFMGYFTTTVSKIFVISGIDCGGANNVIYLTISNAGALPLERSDFVAIRVKKMGEAVIPVVVAPENFTIEPQKAIEINITSPNITKGNSYSVYIATASKYDESLVNC